jgi:putative transposase
MARPLRVHLPGALYHVMSRGDDRQAIFVDAADYRRFLARLAVTTARIGVACPAYCLMRTHFHLLLQPHTLPISRMMQQLNSSYSQWFNRRHRRVGHLLQGRYKSPVVDVDAYFRRVLRYVVLNPVRAGYVSSPADWPWSSYRATAGLEAPPPFLALDFVWDAFDRDRAIAEQVFASYVIGSGPEGTEPPSGSMVFGSEEFQARVGNALEARRADREFSYAQRFACRPPLEQLFAGASESVGLDLAMREAFERHGYTLREIGDCVGRPSGTVWRRIRRAAGWPDVSDCRENAKIEI